MKGVAAIILAAGKGTRMKSGLVKVMHQAGGRPMIAWPVAAAQAAGADRISLVIGHQAEKVQEFFSSDSAICFALQAEQLGTGHAVACARESLTSFDGTVLILCGDVPLIRPETLINMLTHHRGRHATVTVLTTRLANPFGYGRVVEREDGRIIKIVEHKDANEVEREIDVINSGIYCVESSFLFDAVGRLSSNNAQGEYYLTDIIDIAAQENRPCYAFETSDAEEVMGVNDRQQLAQAARIIRQRVTDELMIAGVSIVDPANCYIEAGVIIGADTTIYPNVQISGTTIIGTDCTIEPNVVIRDCRIGNHVTIKSGSVLAESIVHEDVAIGPMAHLRPGTELKAHVKIGNFVETKKIVMGEGSKASHLTYLGDAEIGRDVNIGCGTITCNYDGVKKHKTIIGDDVFVGSDVQLVAPVTIGRNSLIAAGTTVTQDVPEDSLELSRTPQVNKIGWKLKKK